jgi:hypothetical protein
MPDRSLRGGRGRADKGSGDLAAVYGMAFLCGEGFIRSVHHARKREAKTAQ